MKDKLNYIFDTLAIVGTLVQTEHVFQIISLVLTCISVILSLTLTIYKWYKRAKQDGKIDGEEINSAISEINKAVDEIKHTINKEDASDDK